MGRTPRAIELGLLRHPWRRDLRPHRLQALNIWLCCALLACLLAVGGAHFARIGYSLNAAQFNAVMVAFAAGLVVLAALVVVPRRRVYLATNAFVALVSGFLALQLVQISASPSDAIALDSPLAGEWYVSNAGRSDLINGHSPNESNSLDFHRMGANGRTHTGGSGAPLSDYDGFGLPVLAPADGQIVEVQNDFADTPAGTNGDYANSVVLDIGDDRFVVMGHLKQGSVKVESGMSCGVVNRSPRSGTPVTRTNRTCTSRSRTTPQVTRCGPTPSCSATCTSPRAVPGRGVTAPSCAPATSSRGCRCARS